jgi:hypothetical protein
MVHVLGGISTSAANRSCRSVLLPSGTENRNYSVRGKKRFLKFGIKKWGL